ncbi:hypothetical protein PG984_004036 [Apiospora sp. TS-2023a]
MSQFHSFLRLPLELRQQIWHMSMEPRELVICGIKRRSTAKWPAPPAVLHACHESRTYLQQRSRSSSYYVKAFQIYQNRAVYLWVNFDLDSVYAHPSALENFTKTDLAKIQRITLEGVSSRHFIGHHASTLRSKMPALRDVTILSMDCDRNRGWWQPWWRPWAPLFEVLYYPKDEEDDPAPFNLRVLRPEDEPPSTRTPGWLNPDNYHKQWRILGQMTLVSPGIWMV